MHPLPPRESGSPASAPPPIPPSRVESGQEPGLGLLLWVHSGVAHIDLPSGRRDLRSGEGLWIPADQWRRVTTEPGAVAFPHVFVPEVAPAGLDDVTPFWVAPEWHDGLIQFFAQSASAAQSFGYSENALLGLLTPRGLPALAHSSDPPLLPMPTSPRIRDIAVRLRSSPGLERSIEDWAALAACSPSTLLRAFSRETGMSFAQWRGRCRLIAARELLGAGHSVGAVSSIVGFRSTDGFARAYRKHYGATPSTHQTRGDLRSARATPGGTGHTDRKRASGPSEPLIEMLTSRPLPPTSTMPHTNGEHVLTWMYRGSGWLRLAGRDYVRDTGEAVWIPAGLRHDAGSDGGSIGMPIGYLHPSEVPLSEPIRARFPPSWDLYLLHCAVSVNTRLRPAEFDHRRIEEVFRHQFALQRSQETPIPAEPRAREYALRLLSEMQVLHPLPLAQEHEHEAAFQAELGMSIRGWRHHARMNVAKDLLSHGAKSAHVAARLGYTAPSNFSRAFRAFHGVSPRAYQQVWLRGGRAGGE